MQGELEIWTCSRCGHLNTDILNIKSRFTCESCRSVFDEIEMI